jgi:hypothetical protein
MTPRRAKMITSMRMMLKITIRIPGIPGMVKGPRLKGLSTTRRASPPQLKRTAPITAPVVLPSPPTTMMISKLKVKKNVNNVGDIVVIRWANRPPDTPEKKALTTNASKRVLKGLIPIARAADSSSLMDFIARP